MHDTLLAKHVRVLAISPDTPSEAGRLADELSLPFTMLSDETHDALRLYRASDGHRVRPTAYLLDPRGRIAWEHVGVSKQDQPLPERVMDMLSGKHRFPVPSPSEVLTPVFVAGIALVIVALGALAAQANLKLLPWDEPIRDWIRDLGAGRTASAMEWITDLGSRWLIAALTIPMAILGWRRCRQIIIVLIIALPAALLLELLLKGFVDRPRPPFGDGFGASFPSGHVLGATAFWGLVPPWIYLVTQKRWAWVSSVAVSAVILVLVGVSRVFLGAHWPSDVVGGYLVGAIFLLAAEWLVRRPVAKLHCRACEFHPLRSLIHHQSDAVKTSG